MPEQDAAAADRDEPSAGPGAPLEGAAMEVTDFDKRLKLIAAHLVFGMAVLSLWAAADTWQVVTGLAIASLLSVGTGFVAGFVLGTLIHEWFHFAGARLAGASYTVPGNLGLFVFNFDFQKNSVSQFLTMSYAGQVGSWVAVLLFWLSIPVDSAGRAMFVSAAIGGAVFAGAIEWPVIKRTRLGGHPGLELAKIDKDVLYRSATLGLAVTGLSWLVLLP